jgi:hypothetical protein
MTGIPTADHRLPAGFAAEQVVDELFIEIVCADEDLLSEEFAAIIAGSWPGGSLVKCATIPEPGNTPLWWATAAAERAVCTRSAIRLEVRQRSPPLPVRLHRNWRKAWCGR